MNPSLNRRLFLKRTGLAASALSLTPIWTASNSLAAEAGKKLNCALIGCGGRGMAHLGVAADENLVAIVDPDENRYAVIKKWFKDKDRDPGKLQTFTDYRRMFDKVGKDLDVVFVATPNHHHALPTMIALQSGKNVYCEKPLTHNIAEARKLSALARQYKVATQMGNQGHCTEGYRRLCEYVWAGTIGQITETFSWTDRANGGEGPRPPVEPVPAGLHWDEWIGPAPYRDYHSDLHPHEWHGWYDFGNGSIGNMGCHVLDGAFWALKLEHPKTIQVEQMRGGSNERYPMGSRIRWDFPARGDMAPVKVYWFEGLKQGVEASAKGNLRVATGAAQNIPPLLAELREKYADDEFESNGTLYVGEKGVIYTGTYGDRMHILPWDKMRATPAPPKALPRPKNIMLDFLDACRAGKTETAASFEYGARLTEFTLLGNLAQYAGVDKPVEWDGPEMKVTNLPELNRFVSREYRSGWHA